MSNPDRGGSRLKPLLLTAAALALAGPALAQEPAGEPRPTVSRKQAASSNATINLVNLLVKQGVLTQEQADGLIKQAEDEAYVARQAARDATAKADDAARQASAASAATSPAGTKRVTYVPDLVKRQIRDEIREEVMAKAEKEGWASPGKYPDWASRIRFYGDIRARYEMLNFPKGNAPDFVNFGAINSGAPFDVSPGNLGFPPYFNTNEDRERFRLRARVGLQADINDQFEAGFRFATGENNSPVSTNQTFGANGGDFSKYALWLDRAYVAWRPFDRAAAPDDQLVTKGEEAFRSSRDLAVYLGRFDNPFFTETELVWDSDLGFDGVAVKASYQLNENLRPFAVAGAFPIFNTDLNAGFNLDQDNNFPSKSQSDDRYLFGGQIGVGGEFASDYRFKAAASYFDFTNVAAKLSAPCFVTSASTVCDTDIRRPSFAQKGNTYRPLRNIVPFAGNDFGASNQFQYYGLASDFRTLVLSGQLALAQFAPISVVLDGEFVKNLAFDRSDAGRFAVNNRGPVDATTGASRFEGGDTGWAVRLTVGSEELKRLWDWKVHVGYRRLESDATVDAFTDSDFGLGGTNLKGYTVGGSLGLGDGVSTSVKWMSADSVAGAPYSVDILQLDLNAKF